MIYPTGNLGLQLNSYPIVCIFNSVKTYLSIIMNNVYDFRFKIKYKTKL